MSRSQAAEGSKVLVRRGKETPSLRGGGIGPLGTWEKHAHVTLSDPQHSVSWVLARSGPGGPRGLKGMLTRDRNTGYSDAQEDV